LASGFSSIDVDGTPSSLSPPPLGSESDSPPPAHVPPGPDSSPLPVSAPPAPAPGPAPPLLTTGTTSAHASIAPLASAVSSSIDTSPIAGETPSRRTTSKSAGSSSDGFPHSANITSPSSSVSGIVQSSTSSSTSSMAPMPTDTVADTRHRILPLAIAGVTLASLVAILTLLFILYRQYRAKNLKSSIRPASVPFAVEFAHAGPGPKPPLSRLSRLTSSFVSTPSRSSRDRDSRYTMTSSVGLPTLGIR
ncbi:hypothetical protein B0H14DRAFT_2847102, partial [Mycena olivaceomarginata]